MRKLEDFEVKELEVAILEVEVSSETADVTWHKVIDFFYNRFIDSIKIDRSKT